MPWVSNAWLARWFGRLYQGLSPIQRSFINACGGFLLYGAWAVSINALHGHSLDVVLLAGLVQGSFSFIVTFVMTMLLDLTYRWFLSVTDHVCVSVIITVLISCSILFSGSWYINVVFGTPEIFNTVILGYVLGGLYNVAYTLGLARATPPKYR